jgi:hypothetical protein
MSWLLFTITVLFFLPIGFILLEAYEKADPLEKDDTFALFSLGAFTRLGKAAAIT